ncbi:hypothetical protein BC332_18973 [Capsicum chinense]|nr:hypothetical protein BC332_18973 [Capsicum chinense]
MKNSKLLWPESKAVTSIEEQLVGRELREAVERGKRDSQSTVLLYKPLEGGPDRKLPHTEVRESKTTVLYIGRIPHRFYKKETEGFFKQFGTIKKLRLARNKKTGESKHFGFIEFESPEVVPFPEFKSLFPSVKALEDRGVTYAGESPNSVTDTMGYIHRTDMPHTKLTGVQPVTLVGRVSVPCHWNTTDIRQLTDFMRSWRFPEITKITEITDVTETTEVTEITELLKFLY